MEINRLPDIMLIPLKDLQPSLGGSLVLGYPQRCSRCGAAPAEYFETHELRLRAGQKRGGYYRPRYELNKPYHLLIRICRDCYESDYLITPETMKRDATPIGRKARTYALLTTIGGTAAALGVLLLTPLVPAVSFLATLKAWWQAIVLLGLLFIFAAWFIQRQQQKRLQAELSAHGVTPEDRTRADVRTPILRANPDEEAIPLEINITDPAWAKECADQHHWIIESRPEERKRGE